MLQLPAPWLTMLAVSGLLLACAHAPADKQPAAPTGSMGGDGMDATAQEAADPTPAAAAAPAVDPAPTVHAATRVSEICTIVTAVTGSLPSMAKLHAGERHSYKSGTGGSYWAAAITDGADGHDPGLVEEMPGSKPKYTVWLAGSVAPAVAQLKACAALSGGSFEAMDIDDDGVVDRFTWDLTHLHSYVYLQNPGATDLESADEDDDGDAARPRFALIVGQY